MENGGEQSPPFFFCLISPVGSSVRRFVGWHKTVSQWDLCRDFTANQRRRDILK
jgi:hypothetical protein